MHFSSLVGLSAFVAQVSAHGYVQQIKFGSSDYIETWNPYKDPQKGTTINRITRKFLDNGPVTDNLFAVCRLQASLFFTSILRDVIDQCYHLQLRCQGCSQQCSSRRHTLGSCGKRCCLPLD